MLYKRVLAKYKRGFLLEPDIRINPIRFQPGILLQCVGGSKLKTGSIWEFPVDIPQLKLFTQNIRTCIPIDF